MFTVSASPALTTRLPLIIVRTDALIILMLIKPPLHIKKNFPFISWKNLQCNTLNLISWLGLLYLYTKYSIGSSLAALKSEETWHRVKLGLYTTRPTNENQVLVLNIDSHRKTSVCFNKYWFRFTLISGGSSILWRNISTPAWSYILLPLVSAKTKRHN